MSSLSTYIQEFASAYGSQPAITYYHRFRITTYTYDDLFQLALKCASYLITRGVKKGDRVLIYGENSPEWVVILCCSALSGIILVPIDSKSPPEFAEKIRKKTDAKWVISNHILSLPQNVNHLILDNLFNAIEDADPTLLEKEGSSISGNDIFEILFTSGTTADPKGAVIRHRNLIASIASIKHCLVCDHRCRFLSMLPLSHVLEQNAGCLSVLRFGGHIIYTKQVRFSRIMEILIHEKVTHIITVPAILKSFKNKTLEKLQGKESVLKKLSPFPYLIRRLLSFPIRRHLGRHLRAFLCGGASLDTCTESFWKTLGIPVVQGYGLTESCAMVTVNTFKSQKQGSVGKAIPGQEIKLGKKNEVLIRGDNIISEYYQAPELTAEYFQDGWYRTGDVGRFDQEGNLYIIGRLKEMILTSNGLNIFPSDIEKILNDSPAIKESGVFEDPTREGALIGGVILNPDYREVDIKEILKETNVQLGSHQQLSKLVPWTAQSLPKTTSLKIKRRELPEIYKKQEENKETSKPHEDPLINIIAKIANVPTSTLTPQTELNKDLALDSLNLVDLIIDLESHYHIEIDEGKINKECTIEELGKIVTKKGAKAPPLSRFYYSPTGKLLGNTTRTILEHGLIRRWISFRRVGSFPKINLSIPTIFIANHSSHLDTFSVLLTLPRQIKKRLLVAAAYDYFFGKDKKGSALMNPLTIPMFPFHRDTYFSENLKNIGLFLKKGHPLLIFPEGTRSRTGTLAPFKPGIGMIVKEMGAQVVPLYISGAHTLWPPSSSYPKRGKITVQYNNPLTFSPSDSPETITKALEEKVYTLS